MKVEWSEQPSIMFVMNVTFHDSNQSKQMYGDRDEQDTMAESLRLQERMGHILFAKLKIMTV